MKNFLLLLLSILLFSCVGRDQAEVVGFNSKHLIDIYYSTQSIKIAMVDDAIGCFCNNFDNAYCSDEFAEFTNTRQSNTQQSVFSNLAAKNNDNCGWSVSFLQMKGVQPKPDDVVCNRALSKGISKIELESDANFDTEHPAGESLMDIITLEICTFEKELSKTSGFGFVMPTIKPYNSFSKDELKIVGNYFYLKFSKEPTASKKHNLTVTITFDDGEVYSDTVEVKF